MEKGVKKGIIALFLLVVLVLAFGGYTASAAETIADAKYVQDNKGNSYSSVIYYDQVTGIKRYCGQTSGTTFSITNNRFYLNYSAAGQSYTLAGTLRQRNANTIAFFDVETLNGQVLDSRGTLILENTGSYYGLNSYNVIVTVPGGDWGKTDIDTHIQVLKR